jgi:hypothetical protein
MSKLDSSVGLSTKEIGVIKYNIKNEISRQLPELPDPVETRLFLQGRDAWVFSWDLLNKNLPLGENDIISIDVVAKLKREFHDYQSVKHHEFACKVQMLEDLYHPKISVTKKA